MEAKIYSPFYLYWRQVDPAAYQFDPAKAYSLALALIPDEKSSNNESGQENASLEDAITETLVNYYDSWASGWCFSSNGGGPINGWCCSRHSLGTPRETATRVQSALVEWRGWLERLAARFAELAPAKDEKLEAAFEKAVVVLVNDVVAKTNADDAWYGHCGQVLSWYLECHGVCSGAASGLIESVIEGQFKSWVRPDEAAVSGVTTELILGLPSILRE